MLSLQVESNRAILRIDNPPLNVMNLELLGQFEEMLDRLETEDIHVLLLHGEGRAFMAGADIAQMEAFSQADALDFAARGQRVMDRIEALPYPTIALIRGFAFGGGLELALACDLRLLAEGSLIGLPEVSLGIIPGFGGTQRLVEAIGFTQAKRLIFTGRRISADEALKLGIVQSAVAADQLLDEGHRLAELIQKNSPLAVAQAKRAILARLLVERKQAMAAELAATEATLPTYDRQEGVQAFLQQRKPRFRNE